MIVQIDMFQTILTLTYGKRLFSEFNQRVFLEFDDKTCGNNLFLINDRKEFSGPYDLKSFKKTNPFKATELTIQILSNEDCDVTNQSFKIQKFENIRKIVKNKSFYEYRENPVILITGYCHLQMK